MHFMEQDYNAFKGQRPRLKESAVPILYITLNQAVTDYEHTKDVILKRRADDCEHPFLTKKSLLESKLVILKKRAVDPIESKVVELAYPFDESILTNQIEERKAQSQSRAEDDLLMKFNSLTKKYEESVNIVKQLRVENAKLKRRTSILKNQKERAIVQASEDAKEKIKKCLSKRFTDTQIKLMLNPNIQKARSWLEEDIIRALVLRLSSRKCYEQLRRQQNSLLPCEMSLRNYVKSFFVRPGIQKRAFMILKENIALDSRMHSKLGCITFDEMLLYPKYEYDVRADVVVAPAKKAMVAMVRGLCAPWKQPIFVDFDCNMDKSIMEDLLRQCESAGIEIHAIVFDMGNPTFMKEIGFNALLDEDDVEDHDALDMNANYLYQELDDDIPLDETADKPLRYPNPVDPTRMVYCFPDVPHIIKLLRNHLLKGGYLLPDVPPYDQPIRDENDNVIPSAVRFTKQDIEELLIADSNETKILYKLRPYHLQVNGGEKQRVRPAAQLLSRSVASAFRLLFPLKYKTARFVQCVNDFFDVMNARRRNDKCKLKCGFGIHFEEQLHALDQAKKIIYSARIFFFNKKKKVFQLRNGPIACQKAVVHVSNNIKALQNYLKEAKGIEYILTARLNQDCNENYFTMVRYIGHSNPSAKEFLDRIKMLELGANPSFIVKNPAVELEQLDDNEKEYEETVAAAINRGYNQGEASIQETPSVQEEILPPIQETPCVQEEILPPIQEIPCVQEEILPPIQETPCVQEEILPPIQDKRNTSSFAEKISGLTFPRKVNFSNIALHVHVIKNVN